MPTNEVIIGAKYQHDETGAIMRLESGSVPDCEDHVFMIDEEYYAQHNLFIAGWRGSWNEFLSQWTKYEQLELPINSKEYFKIPPIEDWRDIPKDLTSNDEDDDE